MGGDLGKHIGRLAGGLRAVEVEGGVYKLAMHDGVGAKGRS